MTERSPESQSAQILAHLKAGKTITPMEALFLCGSFRLGARIWDLRAEGYDIQKDMVLTEKGARVAQYFLAPEVQA